MHLMGACASEALICVLSVNWTDHRGAGKCLGLADNVGDLPTVIWHTYLLPA